MQYSSLDLHLAEMLVNASKVAGWESLHPVLDSLAISTCRSQAEHSPKVLLETFEALALLLGNDISGNILSYVIHASTATRRLGSISVSTADNNFNDVIRHMLHIPAHLPGVFGTCLSLLLGRATLREALSHELP